MQPARAQKNSEVRVPATVVNTLLNVFWAIGISSNSLLKLDKVGCSIHRE